jgi:hypothetical protein
VNHAEDRFGLRKEWFHRGFVYSLLLYCEADCEATRSD